MGVNLIPLFIRDWRQPKYTGPERRKNKRWRPRPIRVLLVLLAFAAMGYVSAALWLMLQETRLVFEAGSTLAAARPKAPYQQIDIERADRAHQFGWVIPADADSANAPWVLFLHGNASTIASQINLAHYDRLRALGLNVFAPEYRGFGGLDGGPTEPALTRDALEAFDYLLNTRHIPSEHIVVYGWSLGGAVGVHLAASVQPAALILEATPASQLDILESRYPFFPMRLIVRNPFEAIRSIDRVRSPVLVLHSPNDEVIPIADARRLYDAAHEPKAFVQIRGGHVDGSVVDAERVYTVIRAFLFEHGVIASSAPSAGQ